MHYLLGLIILLFRLPAIPQMLMAIPALGLAYFTYSNNVEREAELAAALASDPPALIEVMNYDRKVAKNYAREVNFRVRVLPNFYTILTQKKNLVTTAERAMMVFVDASETADSTVVRGVILAPSDKSEALKAYVRDNMDALANFDLLTKGVNGTPSLVTDVNGTITSSEGVGDVIDKAFDDYNLTRHPDFIHISPFLDGRQAGLRDSTSYELTWVFAILALVFLGLGLNRKRKGPQPKPAAKVEQTQTHRANHAMGQQSVANVKDGPLSRILSQETQPEIIEEQPIAPRIEQAEPRTKKVSAKRGSLFKKLFFSNSWVTRILLILAFPFVAVPVVTFLPSGLGMPFMIVGILAVFALPAVIQFRSEMNGDKPKDNPFSGKMSAPVARKTAPQQTKQMPFSNLGISTHRQADETFSIFEEPEEEIAVKSKESHKGRSEQDPVVRRGRKLDPFERLK